MFLKRSFVTLAAGDQGASRKQMLFALSLAAGLVIVAFMFFAQRGREGGRIIKEGDRAPSFTLSALDNRQLTLSDLRGKVVLVHFWATWCPPCVEEMPKLEYLYRSYKGSGIEILAVSVDESPEAVAAFIQKNRITIPVLRDPDRKTAGRYGTFKFPETYVLDRQGTVRYKVIGPLDWTSAETLTALRRLVEER